MTSHDPSRSTARSLDGSTADPIGDAAAVREGGTNVCSVTGADRW
ncbi:hypothetical protein [Haloplanus pelagicus]|nr:hypothetical protein [Haloplanus sp. HW8-1]